MIYPSGRAVWAGAAGAIPAFLIALALPSLWYLGLLWICVLLAFLAVDAAAGRGRSSLQARIHAPPQVSVGGQFTVNVTARLSGRPRAVQARLGHDERLAPLGGTGGAWMVASREARPRPAAASTARKASSTQIHSRPRYHSDGSASAIRKAGIAPAAPAQTARPLG